MDLTFLTKQLDGTRLTAPEAVRLAADWWDKTGRHLMSKTANREQRNTFKAGNGSAPAIRVKDKGEVVLPSKVLQGFPWDELSRREKASVVRAWLKEYRVWYPAELKLPAVQP